MKEPRYTLPEQLRFWSYVETKASNQCWPWLRSVDGQGYGVFCAQGTRKKSHRVSYILVHGPIPDGLVVDHMCRNRRCANPDHLRVVTQAVNSLENSVGATAINAAKTHCIAGHMFAGDNLKIDHRGNRYCRECNRERQRKPNSRHKRRTTPAPSVLSA